MYFQVNFVVFLFQGKSGGKLAAASFKDELELFSGKQDLSTIVRSDFKGHDRVEVSRHRPKDQIEVIYINSIFDFKPLSYLSICHFFIDEKQVCGPTGLQGN